MSILGGLKLLIFLRMPNYDKEYHNPLIKEKRKKKKQLQKRSHQDKSSNRGYNQQSYQKSYRNNPPKQYGHND
jgi:uncharacterized protein YxeA